MGAGTERALGNRAGRPTGRCVPASEHRTPSRARRAAGLGAMSSFSARVAQNRTPHSRVVVAHGAARRVGAVALLCADAVGVAAAAEARARLQAAAAACGSCGGGQRLIDTRPLARIRIPQGAPPALSHPRNAQQPSSGLRCKPNLPRRPVAFGAVRTYTLAHACAARHERLRSCMECGEGRA